MKRSGVPNISRIDGAAYEKARLASSAAKAESCASTTARTALVSSVETRSARAADAANRAKAATNRKLAKTRVTRVMAAPRGWCEQATVKRERPAREKATGRDAGHPTGGATLLIDVYVNLASAGP